MIIDSLLCVIFNRQHLCIHLKTHTLSVTVLSGIYNIPDSNISNKYHHTTGDNLGKFWEEIRKRKINHSIKATPICIFRPETARIEFIFKIETD